MGDKTAFEYDLAGRLTTVTDALGKTQTFTVDAEGRRIRSVDANEITVSSMNYHLMQNLAPSIAALGFAILILRRLGTGKKRRFQLTCVTVIIFVGVMLLVMALLGV